MDLLKKIIFSLFAILLFTVPLILWPATSEVFEFNKMVFVYIFTTLISAAWLTRCLFVKKIIFRRTILDIPLLIFFASQLISTIISIDPATSVFGYYSRFNGGLLSTVGYILLYWAFVSNLEKEDAVKLIKYSILPSAALVSIYGVLEHFGIDKNVWVQDVASRVFSTLGQPNWLAAWLTALLPITWALAIDEPQTNSKFQILNFKFLIYFSLSILFFWVLIFTKSRSGFLGFVAADFVFWLLVFVKSKFRFWKTFAVYNLSFIVIAAFSGTQYTPSIAEIAGRRSAPPAAAGTQAPALETGGTESGTIRKIVWKGAIDVWKNYPVFGTGVETFAFSYYQFRPAEHNLVSEWDFIYNKAHNEFLNVAANTGSVGLLSYLILIGFSVYIFIQKLKNSNLKSQNLKIENWDLFDIWSLKFGFLAGYLSLLVTNFFGFSVVPTQLEFFLFPAFAVALTNDNTIYSFKGGTFKAKIFILLILFAVTYSLYAISRYWFADILYAKGRAYNSIKKPATAALYLTRAINLEPYQALYHNELAGALTQTAINYYQEKNLPKTEEFAAKALEESQTAINLSPANVNLKRARFGILIMLSIARPAFLNDAKNVLLDAIEEAPTDAKLWYNLGLTQNRLGEVDQSVSTLQKTIELKGNYREARLALAYILIDKKKFAEAKLQLEYILKNIDPNDSLAKQALAGLK